MIGRLESVNVGLPQTVEWFGREVLTSIWKEPVEGRVRAEGVNLVGDAQADLRVHGGPTKAVYVYSVEDYAWWSAQGYDVGPATTGDVWRIGSAVFGVMYPRQPCFKLGIRMGSAEFVTTFGEADRRGIYLTILEAGDVGAGDEIVVER